MAFDKACPTGLLSVDDDALKIIMCCFLPEHLLQLRLTCARLRVAASDDDMWKALDVRADGDDEPPLPWLNHDQRAGEHALALERRLGRARSRALQAPRRERVALALPAAR